MTLAPSTHVGPYEIVSLVGEGGMGQVYKARDTRLDRFVAIKFSPARFSQRFELEAHAIAALNHPNICQIYDIGPDFVVMEYIDGARVSPVAGTRRLLDIAVQIADALATAHAAGFVHRDLKPENVLITREGRVKILDFGVAKDVRYRATGEGTRTVTTPGTVVGTMAYMSPEQARGQEVDIRSDQFSLGLLLFELATGTHPFQRDSTAEMMAAIIREEPPPLPATVPAPLRWLIERCLAKEPADRYESTRDLYRDLLTIRDHLSDTSISASTTLIAKPTRRAWLAAGVGAAGLIAGGAAGAIWQRSRVERQPRWSGLMLGGPAFALGPRISPDGQLLAFVAMFDRQMQVAVTKPDASTWTVLTHQIGDGSVLNVAWSTDGMRLYFDRYWDKPRGVYMIPPLGGEPVLVLENAAAPLPLPDGSLVVLRSSDGVRDQMYRFWPDSGRLEPLPAFVSFWRLTGAMRASSDGKLVVFFRNYKEGGEAPGLCAVDLDSKRVRRLGPGLTLDYRESDPVGVAITSNNRSVVFGVRRDDTYQISSIPLDGGTGVRLLMPVPAAASLWHLDLGKDGSLYLDQVTRPMSLLRVSLDGRVLQETPLPALAVHSIFPLENGSVLFTGVQAGKRHLMIARPGAEPRRFLAVADENSAPFARVGEDAIAFMAGTMPAARIAIASLRTGRIVHQLPFDVGDIKSLSSSPDGRTVYYAAADTIWSVPADGSGAPRRIAQGNCVTADPSGRYLFIKQFGTDPIRLVRLALAGGQPQPIRIPENLRLSLQDFPPAAIDARGRLLLDTASPDSWFYGISLFDPDREMITPVPVQIAGGAMAPNWTADGSITALGVDLTSSVWRYRAVSEPLTSS